jgi:hypothetical protein
MTAPVLLPSSRRGPSPSPEDALSAAHHSGAVRYLFLLHWTSADAVVVVLAFAWALARGGGVVLPWAAYAFLALGIWLGYTADRLLDLEGIPSRAQRTGRHAFHLRHRRILTTMWVVGFLVAWPLAWILLPSQAILAGGGLAAAAALYVWWGSGTSAPGGFPPPCRERRKRRCTAILLATAGVWSLWAGGGDFGPRVGALVGIFAVAAWWNLTLLGHHRRFPSRGLLKGLPTGSTLAAALLLALPLSSGTLLLLPGAAVLVLGLGGLAWRGDALTDDALALAADGTLGLGFLAMGAALALAAG